MLDPLSDTPLKLYEVAPEDIEKLNDVNWKPQLYLTSREREIVETEWYCSCSWTIRYWQDLCDMQPNGL